MAYPHTKGVSVQIVETMPATPEILTLYYDLSDATSPLKMKGLDGVVYTWENSSSPAGALFGDLSGATDGQLLSFDDATEKFVPADAVAAAPQLALYQYRVADEVQPAVIAGDSWETVPLATEVHDSLGSSLAASTITLPAGDYLLEYWVSVYDQGMQPGGELIAQCRIYDNTGEAEVANSGGLAPQLYESGGSTTIDGNVICHGSVKVSPAASNGYKLQVWTQAAGWYGMATPGAPANWTSQVCAEIKITKL